jgi:hypothetical protein
MKTASCILSKVPVKFTKARKGQKLTLIISQKQLSQIILYPL